MNEEAKTRRQDRWDAKAGVISRGYKVNKAVADEFKETCNRLGISMGPQLTKMMKEFIEANK